MRSALYEGVLSHRRHLPTPHAFCYPVFMAYLHLDELDAFFAQSRLWSLERFNWASFRRQDFLNPAIPDLREAVQQEILRQTGQIFTGDIALLTHVRYLGYGFNPVSFYYGYEKGTLVWILAEINNTPWGERFCYVLRCQPGQNVHRFEFGKRFHVSPFLPLDMSYQWQFNTPGEQVTVLMRNCQDDRVPFQAGLVMRRHEASTRTLNRMLLRYPAVTVKTIAGIYWHALRLKLKGTPFFDHPPSPEIFSHDRIDACPQPESDRL